MIDKLALPAHQERTEPQWRCFHCDEVFTDKAEAREHFGELMDDDPLCQIKADEGGLAGEIRRLEAEVLRICHERNESENDARLWHESEADRVRRIGNHQWWFHLDCLEGEKLVLQERIAELEKQVGAPASAAEWQPLEVCICAAVKFADGQIVRGHRHDSCFRTAERWTPKPDGHGHIQGFITSRNRFVTREEGTRLQNAAGIVSAMTGRPIVGVLFSEDLYSEPLPPCALTGNSEKESK